MRSGFDRKGLAHAETAGMGLETMLGLPAESPHSLTPKLPVTCTNSGVNDTGTPCQCWNLCKRHVLWQIVTDSPQVFCHSHTSNLFQGLRAESGLNDDMPPCPNNRSVFKRRKCAPVRVMTGCNAICHKLI